MNEIVFEIIGQIDSVEIISVGTSIREIKFFASNTVVDDGEN